MNSMTPARMTRTYQGPFHEPKSPLNWPTSPNVQLFELQVALQTLTESEVAILSGLHDHWKKPAYRMLISYQRT